MGALRDSLISELADRTEEYRMLARIEGRLTKDERTAKHKAGLRIAGIERALASLGAQRLYCDDVGPSGMGGINDNGEG